MCVLYILCLDDSGHTESMLGGLSMCDILFSLVCYCNSTWSITSTSRKHHANNTSTYVLCDNGALGNIQGATRSQDPFLGNYPLNQATQLPREDAVKVERRFFGCWSTRDNKQGLQEDPEKRNCALSAEILLSRVEGPTKNKTDMFAGQFPQLYKRRLDLDARRSCGPLLLEF